MDKSDRNDRIEFLTDDAKLRILCQAAPECGWQSLDDRRQCILCENTISGRQVRVARGRHGKLELRCPTHRCNATPAEWVHLGNPLISEVAWRDWLRLFNECDGEMIAVQKAGVPA